MFYRLFSIHSYHYAYSAWPPLIVGSCIFILILAILLRERFSRVSRSFGGLGFWIILWLLSIGAEYSARTEWIALVWAKVHTLSICFIPAALLHFTLRLTQKSLRWRPLLMIVWAVSAAFAAAAVGSPRFLVGLTKFPWGYYASYGTIGAAFIAFFIVSLAGNVALIYRTARSQTFEARRRQLQRFVVAFIVGALGMIDFFPCFRLPVYPVGFLPVYTMFLMLAEAIWQYHFAEITPAAAAPQIMETIPSLLVVVDLHGQILLANRAAEAAFHTTQVELRGKSIEILFPELWSPEHRHTLESAGRLYVKDVKPNPQRPRWYDIAVSMITDPANNPLAFVCIAIDQSNEKALAQTEERFRMLVESVQDYAIFMLDPDGRIVSWNSGAQRINGYRSEEIIGSHFSCFYPPEDRHRERPQQNLERARRDGRWEEEGWRLRKDGSRFWASVVLTALHDPDGAHSGFAKVVRDITERRTAQEALKQAYDEMEQRVIERTQELRKEVEQRKQAEEALRQLSLTDPLTGLYNRRGFVTLAKQQIELSRREKKTLLLLMIDLDGLKPINDQYGHLEGDEALKQAAAILKSTCRRADIVARIGGDEFALVALEDASDGESELAQRLQIRLDEHNRLHGRPYRLSFSTGLVTITPDEHATLDQLLSHADTLLYEEKRRKSEISH